MKSVLKWIGITFGGLLALIVLGLITVYAISAPRPPLSKAYPRWSMSRRETRRDSWRGPSSLLDSLRSNFAV